jgi:IS30 family transposase
LVKKRIRIKDQVSIDPKTIEIEKRLEAGHLEGDLMIGVGLKVPFGTIVDKSRYVILSATENQKQ